MLNARTEGWPTGLYLAALSLQASPDLAVAGFGGDDRFVADYLRSEHLSQLEPKEVEFLANLGARPDDRAALRRRPRPERLGGDAGQARAREPLRRRARPSQRVVPVPPSLPRHAPGGLARPRARCRDRAQRTCGHLVRRARDAGLGGPARARRRRPDVGERPRGHERDPVHPLGPRRDRGRWLRAFDDADLLDRYPAVAVFGTFIHAQRGRPEVAERWAQAVESSGFDGVMPDGSTSLRPWAALVRAMLYAGTAWSRCAPTRTRCCGIDPRSPLRPVALMFRGVACLLGGDASEAERALDVAADAAALQDSTYAGVIADCELALVASTTATSTKPNDDSPPREFVGDDSAASTSSSRSSTLSAHGSRSLTAEVRRAREDLLERSACSRCHAIALLSRCRRRSSCTGAPRARGRRRCADALPRGRGRSAPDAGRRPPRPASAEPPRGASPVQRTAVGVGVVADV